MNLCLTLACTLPVMGSSAPLKAICPVSGQLGCWKVLHLGHRRASISSASWQASLHLLVTPLRGNFASRAPQSVPPLQQSPLDSPFNQAGTCSLPSVLSSTVFQARPSRGRCVFQRSSNAQVTCLTFLLIPAVRSNLPRHEVGHRQCSKFFSTFHLDHRILWLDI